MSTVILCRPRCVKTEYLTMKKGHEILWCNKHNVGLPKAFIWLDIVSYVSCTALFVFVWGVICFSRVDSRFAPSQWETALLCNDVSDWLGASLESALRFRRRNGTSGHQDNVSSGFTMPLQQQHKNIIRTGLTLWCLETWPRSYCLLGV